MLIGNVSYVYLPLANGLCRIKRPKNIYFPSDAQFTAAIDELYYAETGYSTATAVGYAVL